VVHDDDYRERIYLPGILRTWSAISTEIEPNDTPAQANVQAASGVTYYGSFPSESDVNDYFYIVLDTAHTVEGWLTNIPADRNYDLVLRYDFAPYEVVPNGYSGNLGNADEYFLTGVLAPGRYLIQVFHREEPRLGSTQSYHLRVVYE
jgi:hypothetical protein